MKKIILLIQSKFLSFCKKKDDLNEPYTVDQFNIKYHKYSRVVIRDWATINDGLSIGEQIANFKSENPNTTVYLKSINDNNTHTFGLVAFEK